MKATSTTTKAKANSKAAPKRSGPSVEEIYQKKTPLEHILLRPDTYIGSVESIEDELWVFNPETKRMVTRKVRYTPGLYKIVDEILVNAADNKSNDPSMKKIEVTIDKENGVISIMNDGKGIPVEIHKEHNCYVPELIFGHLLSSSNYNDTQERTTGGRNGYGAKLCNIFSTEFTVETADGSVKKKYRQVFTDNMRNKTKPSITKFGQKREYTKITFKPDFSKFNMTHLDDDTIALITRRVYDLAGCVNGIRVYLNGEVIPITGFKTYVGLYLNPPANDPENPLPTKGPEIVYKRFNDNWEVAFAVSDGQFNQVSFVNSINTIRGGTHVNYVADQIIKKFIAQTKKGKVSIKPQQVRNNIWLFVNSKIVNPTFDAQTKETLTLRTSAFKTKCEVTDDFMKNVMKSELKEFVDMAIRRKEERDLKKTDGTRTSRITGIEKLDDANMAGGRHGRDCTLILTEGDSAKTLAVAGLGVQGRDKFGIFALRGKPLNVRDASSSQIADNKEFTHIKHILGLKHGTKYTSVENLRYGHVLIMADQDVDGSHIKGLLINMFDSMYPGLLEVKGFLQQFITPVVRLTNKRTNERMDFYTESEFKSWFEAHAEEAKSWRIKYYKGLGTSKASDAHEYFRNLDFHRKSFDPAKVDDRKMVDMAFNKTRANDRKEWLASYQPGVWVDNSKSSIGIEEFINKELVLFSMEDNSRSIPSVVDGLKPGQRKILWTSLEANIKDEIKVVTLQGKVTEKAAYHHGDASLIATVVNMAQDFVGSNNINLFMPEGGFGTRLAGGKDAASARYIATFLSKITRRIFQKNDDPLLENLADDGKRVEPRWYMPVIPMVLVNGADGIGTGWSTSIPNYNPTDIIANIRRLMRQEPVQPMMPWYRGFRGTIEKVASDRYTTLGAIEKISDTELHISELPIKVWTNNYKTQLNKWMAGTDKSASIIKDFRYNASILTVDATMTLTAEQMAKALSEGLETRFKLSSSLATSNMVCFDREGRLRKYGSAEEIIEDFYPLRLRYYQLRKENMAEKLGQDLQMADNRARFVLEIIQKKLSINNRKRKDIIKDLQDRDYAPIHKKNKTTVAVAGDLDSEQAAEAAEEAERDTGDAGGYDYLLSMPIWNLTMEKVEKLLKEKSDIEKKLEDLLALTPIDLWTTDLDDIEKEWKLMCSEYEQRLLDDEENRRSQGGGDKKGKGSRAKATKPKAPRKQTTAASIAAVGSKDKKPTKASLVRLLDDDGKFVGKAKKPKTETNVSREGSAKPKVSMPQVAAASHGSDLDDSDDDVASTILKKVAMKKIGAAAVQPTKQTKPLEEMFSKLKKPPTTSTAASSTTVTPTEPAKKRTLQRKKVAALDSSDYESDGDSDVVEAVGKAREPTSRRAATTNRKPVYMDISDDSDDDFVG